MFASLIIRLFQLVFSAGTVFFSHNKSVGTVFRLVFSAKRTRLISHLYDLAKTNLHCHSTIYKSILISLKVYYLSLNNHFFLIYYFTHHYWIQVVPEALGKGQIALGKAFVEYGTRQRTHNKKLIGKALFAECLLSGTRQRKATVTTPAPLTVDLPSANSAGTRQGKEKRPSRRQPR